MLCRIVVRIYHTLYALLLHDTTLVLLTKHPVFLEAGIRVSAT